MNQQPDKLFKEKLENYQRPAPADAWSRIEAGLPKKNNNYMWLKIAASLLLLSVFIYGILNISEQKDNSQEAVVQQNNIKEKTEATETIEESSPQEEQALPAAKEESQSRPTITSAPGKKSKPAIKKQKEILDVNEPKQTLANSTDENFNDQLTDVAIEENTNEVTQTNSKNFMLVVEADEVNKKYLRTETVAQATSSDNSSSGIKKLLDKAQDLKNNQDAFGDLRQMKNEILALNFQTNKKNEQHK